MEFRASNAVPHPAFRVSEGCSEPSGEAEKGQGQGPPADPAAWAGARGFGEGARDGGDRREQRELRGG